MTDSQQHPPVVSLGDWLVTLLLLAIPIVNIIVLIVWAVSGSTNPNKGNFAKATLIVMAITVVLWTLFLGSIIGNAIGSMVSSTT